MEKASIRETTLERQTSGGQSQISGCCAKREREGGREKGNGREKKRHTQKFFIIDSITFAKQMREILTCTDTYLYTLEIFRLLEKSPENKVICI